MSTRRAFVGFGATPGIACAGVLVGLFEPTVFDRVRGYGSDTKGTCTARMIPVHDACHDDYHDHDHDHRSGRYLLQNHVLLVAGAGAGDDAAR